MFPDLKCNNSELHDPNPSPSKIKETETNTGKVEEMSNVLSLVCGRG